MPLNDETRNLIDEPVLAAFPPTAFLINTARGEVIDEAALLSALKEKRIAGAALDVICGEQAGGNGSVRSALLDYARENANLIVTPHIGGATVDAMAATEVFMARKLARYLKENGLD